LPLSPATGGLYSGVDSIEIGVRFTAGPTVGTLADFTGQVQLVPKVDGFDYGLN
jgi:hypothetical protein